MCKYSIEISYELRSCLYDLREPRSSGLRFSKSLEPLDLGNGRVLVKSITWMCLINECGVCKLLAVRTSIGSFSFVMEFFCVVRDYEPHNLLPE